MIDTMKLFQIQSSYMEKLSIMNSEFMIPNGWAHNCLDNSPITMLPWHIPFNPGFTRSLCSSTINLNGCDVMFGVSPALRNDARIVLDVLTAHKPGPFS
jgi:hypothetical protein